MYYLCILYTFKFIVERNFTCLKYIFLVYNENVFGHQENIWYGDKQ